MRLDPPIQQKTTLRKVLLIAQHFPPDIHPGAKRLGKFAKYLPSYGWQPIVLTKQVQYYHGIDQTLLKNLNPRPTIYRISEWHLGNSPKGRSKSTQIQSDRDHMTLGHILARWFYRLSHTLDFAWLFPAFCRGLWLTIREPIDIILTSYPTQDALIVGLLLKLVTGKKWVVDFRDLSPSFPRGAWGRSGGVALRLVADKILDKIIIRKADVITAVGKRMRQDMIDVFGPKISGKVYVVYNGYDPTDFELAKNCPPKGYPGIADGTLIITYLGSWTTLDTPEYFLRALGRLLRKRACLQNKIRFIQIGEVRYDSILSQLIPRWIREEKLSEVVLSLPYLSHAEALSWLKISSVALIVQNGIIGCPGTADHTLPSKGFEYLWARKPILALAPLQGELAYLIRACNAGEVVTPDDVEAIEETIYSMYEAFRNGTLNRDMNVSVIEQFDRRRQTQALASILDTLVI